LKIAFVTTDITNNAGTERVIVNLSNYFCNIGYTVEVHSLCSLEGGPYYELNPEVTIKHYKLLDYSVEVSSLKKLGKKIYNAGQIYKILYAIKADFIIGSGKNINIFMAWNRKNRATLIGCEHFPYNAPMTSFTRLLRKWSYPRLDYVVVLTNTDRHYYSSFAKNVKCIPNSLSFFPSVAAKLDNKTVLAIGRHTHEKGFDLLLQIWAKIFKKNPDWTLKIIGSGPLLEEHQKMAGQLEIISSVSFHIESKAIVEEYQKASIFVMTSRYEAFPMVLLEAMACGLPCISLDCDTGPRNIIQHQIDGFVIPLDDQHTFIEHLSLLMNDSTKRKEMGNAARDNIKRFDIQQIGNKWIELFETRHNRS